MTLDETIVEAARSQLGVPYLYGGERPKGDPVPGFDCSGLTQWSCGKAGLLIPRTSEEQWAAGGPILPHLSVIGNVGDAQITPGDLVYFTGDPTEAPPGHCGIIVTPPNALGIGYMIDAPYRGTDVRIDQFNIHETSNEYGLQFVGIARPTALGPPNGGDVAISRHQTEIEIGTDSRGSIALTALGFALANIVSVHPLFPGAVVLQIGPDEIRVSGAPPGSKVPIVFWTSP